VLIFTRTKHGANRLTQQLERAGINAMAIHGNKSQNARVKALQDFKENRITALVATEVAARGLDIKELPHVVNYELPNVPEDYVHRIGRTARAGSTGAAISLVSPDELSYLRDIEKLLKRKIDFVEPPKFEIKEGTHTPRNADGAEYQPHQDPRRRPEQRRSGGGGGHQGGRRGGGGGGRREPGRASHEAYLPAGDGTQAQGGSGQPGGDAQRHEQRRNDGQRAQHPHRSGEQRGGGQRQGQGGKPAGHSGGKPQGGRAGGGPRGGSRGGQSGFARGARSGSSGRGNGGSSGGGGFSRMG
jgi:ATP-dependent RNA helicase RhlE